MSKDDRVSFVLVAVLIAAFAVGVTYLFLWRFRVGDVYPAYSSLRADPLGTKVFYDSLKRMPEMTAQRNYQPLSKIQGPENTTAFYCGASTFDLTYSGLSDELSAFVAGGGRLVVALYPVTSVKPWWAQIDEEREKREKLREGKDKEKKTDTKREENAKREDASDFFLRHPVTERWGISFEYVMLPGSYEGHSGSATAYSQDVADVPESVSWHTTLVFDKLHPAWRTVYERGGRPVMIERRFGKGMIVLSADSYYLSNEAMRQERHPDLLAWLVGPNRHVVFDETHLGVVEEAGIAALGRKYRLHGLVAGLLLLAGLFIWKNVVSFVPAHDDELVAQEGQLEQGKDSTAALVNLLRRSIPGRTIMTACFDEWKKSVAYGGVEVSSQTSRIQKVIDEENALPVNKRNPVRCYRAICELLAERKRL